MADKRPLEKLMDRGFLAEPRPETICAVSAFGAEGMRVDCAFDIGIKIIAQDRQGRKIVPTPQIVFAMTKDDDERFIDMPPSMVRELIPRLQEMCDAAEKIHPSACESGSAQNGH
jgi:hypothetical protein